MSNLYDLTSEMLDLMETEEEVNDELMLQVFGDIQNKSENICKFIKVVDSNIAAFKAEEERLATRRKAMENRVRQIKDFLKLNMERLSIDKLSAGTFSIALQNNPPALKFSNEKEAPDAYIIIIPEQRVPDRNRIMSDLKEGKEIPGWWLERGKHVRIR